MTQPPVTDDFWADAAEESRYQSEHWGEDHDNAKSDDEWFWTLGFLAGKVLRPDADVFKKRHRLRAAAALLHQWDQRLARREP